MFRFRLCDEDREKYGGPEWVTFDLSRAVELEVDLLEQIEDATGYTLLVTLPPAIERGTLKALRAAVWLARHIAGVHAPDFPAFKPNLLRATTEPVPAADADPPEPANRAERRARTRTTKRSSGT